MASVLEDLPHGSRVAIIRLRSLGDCVLTTPAIELLQRARPDLRLAVMVEGRFRAVFEGNPDIETLLPPHLPPLWAWRPRLCLNLHGGTRSAVITALSGAPRRAGYGHFRHSFVYNAHIPRAQQILGVERTVHTAEHAASAMFWLGVPVGEIPRAKLFAESRTGGPTAVIHPFASTPGKTWRADGFLTVAAHLQGSGLEPVFIGAPDNDLSAFSRFQILRGAPLSEIKSLLAGASLFVGNDSGPAHMAAAFGVPVVAIFGESDPAIWGPWRTASEVVSIEAEPGRVLEAISRLGVHA